MSKIGVLGSGGVGQTLAKGLQGKGHAARIASRSGDKLAAYSAETGVQEGTFADVAAWADLVILAVQGGAAEGIVRALAPQLAGKIVIDANNPISGPPVDGLLPYFTTDRSLMELLAAAAPEARFVKAFSSVGAHLMIDPKLPGGRPTMFICGDDPAAKAEVVALLDSVGWDAEDVGKAPAAKAIEALCQLWCAPGILHNDWVHAFKVLRPAAG